ncbi:MAG TPA: F0F1 ATP synthase subunit B [Candidatus Eremiobacteraeota bacterium]|nr:MAG: ATP synthase subunit b, sodium ion specific [bacterium ADurb.Bin363]HPZ08349.1 F0F1 ATP synthase subunit B [Candidatus Eremiobacteraeota bacterium]
MEIAPDLTLVVQVTNFLILFGILKWKLFGPIMKILEEREEKIRSDITKAEQARQEALDLKKDYEDQLKDAAREVRIIVQDATLQGEKIKSELMEKGRAEALRIKEEGQAQVKLEKERAISSLRAEVAGLSVNLASRLLKKNIDENSNRALIQEFIGDLKS